ncbi:tRNA modification radical SAM protein MnmL/YtqA [Clostridium sp. DL1XJH146]
MENKWGTKRYHSLNYFLRDKFGTKVYKISLDGGFSCPNRDGTISSGGCIFCSERGSGDYAGDRRLSITEQFNDIKEKMQKKWKEGKYIAYFQAYTNTYAPVDILRKKYEEAIEQEGVIALAIATRADCLSQEVLDLLKEFGERVYVWVELGLQTSNEETALVINRGYKLQVFEDAVENLRERNIDVIVHTIYGLPGETDDDMLNTIKYLANKDIQGIKMHLLHLMRDTPLVNFYSEKGLDFLTMERYVDLICKSITLLPANVVIHRLTGDSPRDMLIEPMWSLKKWEVLNAIDRKLENDDLYQGLYYLTN